MRGFLGAVSALIFVASAAQARAADFDTYVKLIKETVRELASGDLADPEAAQQRLKAAMAIGIEACNERAKAVPGDARLMELVVAKAPTMIAMKADELESTWGDEGTAGDAAGIPLTAIDQFSEVRNYLDLVVHPARAYDLITSYVQSKDKQTLERAKSELVEVIEHAALIKKP